MRSSKTRSRSKSNRSGNNRSMGNIVNRVFESSGPEGKVRGTPQQIIEKYNQLARDAQLSNDRVAAENFQQHAEHYLRMLAEAQREQNERREQQEREQSDRRDGQQDDGRREFRDGDRQDGGGDRGGRNDRDDRDQSYRRDQGESEPADRPLGRDRYERVAADTREPRHQPDRGTGDRDGQIDDRSGERTEDSGDERTEEGRRAPESPAPSSASADAPAADTRPAPRSVDSAVEVIDTGSDDAGLVETPEDKPSRPRRPRRPRRTVDEASPLGGSEAAE